MCSDLDIRAHAFLLRGEQACLQCSSRDEIEDAPTGPKYNTTFVWFLKH